MRPYPEALILAIVFFEKCGIPGTTGGLITTGVDDATRVKRDGTRYIPIRVFYANLGGAGQFRLSTAGYPAPQIKIITCSGDQVAPYWLPWEQE